MPQNREKKATMPNQLITEVEKAELSNDIRKIADKMYPQLMKDSYSRWEVGKLLIAVQQHYDSKLQSLEQAVRAEEREKTLKSIYRIVMENGSAERSWILHKLARIIQGEESI